MMQGDRVLQAVGMLQQCVVSVAVWLMEGTPQQVGRLSRGSWRCIFSELMISEALSGGGAGRPSKGSPQQV